MSELERFEQLAALARGDAPPSVDVADSVIAAIRTVRIGRPSAIDRWTLGFTVASVLAASIMVMIVWHTVDQPVIAEVPNPLVGPVMGSE